MTEKCADQVWRRDGSCLAERKLADTRQQQGDVNSPEVPKLG
jgi:hypothetical protein